MCALFGDNLLTTPNMPRAVLTNGFKCDSFQGVIRLLRVEMKRQLACKPGSVHKGCPLLDDHSSGAPVARRFVQPTRAAGRKQPWVPKHPCRPYSVLLQVGFAWPIPVTRDAVRSYRTFSPLPRKRGGLFLWHFPWGCPRRTLSGTLIPWSPDFPLPPAFRHLKRAAIRPTGEMRG